MPFNILDKIKEEFNNSSDLIARLFQLKNKQVLIVFLESIVSSKTISSQILRKVNNKLTSNEFINSLSNANLKKLKESQVPEFLTNAWTVLIINEDIYALETKGELIRSISLPDTQPAIQGPKDSFTESIQINLGLIKRRIKSSKLLNIDFFIGRKTNTKVSLIYMDDVANKEIVLDIKERLEKIDTDGILDASYISGFITKENKSVFPSIFASERPDMVSASLLEGRVAILIDNSPYVLILPVILLDFINPSSDEYNKAVNVNFIKIMRLICFFLTIFLPAIYIIVTTWTPEILPTSFLLNLKMQRSLVSFPSIIEITIMLIICEILRESDIRFPNSYGSAISILGGLVIGEAAVNAGIISPIMIIIVAVTFISSLIFNDVETYSAVRYFRFVLLFLGGLLGLWGGLLGFIYLMTEILAADSFKVPYFYPIIPFDWSYFKKKVFKIKRQEDLNRSFVFSPQNITKQKGKR